MYAAVIEARGDVRFERRREVTVIMVVASNGMHRHRRLVAGAAKRCQAPDKPLPIRAMVSR